MVDIEYGQFFFFHQAIGLIGTPTCTSVCENQHSREQPELLLFGCDHGNEPNLSLK